MAESNSARYSIERRLWQTSHEVMPLAKLFESKKIGSEWNGQEEKWYFAVVDVIGALTDSDKPRDYWYRLKRREFASSEVQLSTFCRQVRKMKNKP